MDVIVLLRTLSCGRTRWLVTVDIHTPHLCCTCLSRISEKIRLRDNVQSGANSLPGFSRHTTISSVVSVHNLLPCPNLQLVIRSDRDWRITSKVLQKTRACQKITFNSCRKKRATSATTAPAGTNQNREILDELAERLGNFHDSTRALAHCLQTRDVARETDQSLIEAAKCMFHKLLG